MLAYRRVISNRACLSACTFLAAGFSWLSLITPGVRRGGGVAMRRTMNLSDVLKVHNNAFLKTEFPGSQQESAGIKDAAKFGLEIDFTFTAAPLGSYKQGDGEKGTVAYANKAAGIIKLYCGEVMGQEVNGTDKSVEQLVAGICKRNFITAAIDDASAEFKTDKMTYKELVEKQGEIVTYIYNFRSWVQPDKLWQGGFRGACLARGEPPVDLLGEGGFQINMDIGAFKKNTNHFANFYAFYNAQPSDLGDHFAYIMADHVDFVNSSDLGAFQMELKKALQMEIKKALAINAHWLNPTCLLELARSEADHHKYEQVQAWVKRVNPKKIIDIADEAEFEKFLKKLLLLRTFFANYFWLMIGVPLTMKDGEVDFDEHEFYVEENLRLDHFTMHYYMGYFERDWLGDNATKKFYQNAFSQVVVGELNADLVKCAWSINYQIFQRFYEVYRPNGKMEPQLFDPHYDKVNIDHVAEGLDLSRLELRDRHRSTSFENDLRQVENVIGLLVASLDMPW